MADVKELKEKLFSDTRNGLKKATEEQIKEAYAFCEDYKKFLDNAKTEREAVTEAIKIAQNNGFTAYEKGKKYVAGDRYYINNRKKSAVFVVVGEESAENGVRIGAAHIDSPRLDLKPNPLYEEIDLALFKTHYYGGVRKYQWATIPLALHGVFVKKSGETINVKIGEDASDPVFVINDLLPHLASEQNKRTLNEGIKGEELNVLVGSFPFKADEGSELVKLNILNILYEKYGVTESDFLSAELEIVPAFKAQDVGFDRALIGSYGHDDRVCAYPSLMALMDIKVPKRTAICVLADKEEIGSVGNTGLNSHFLLHVISDIARMQGVEPQDALRKSQCLSADVNAAVDPTFQDVFEKRNASFVNNGVVITKYTGARGKSGSNDASAEYMAEIRQMLDSANIVWQTGELGKVDIGGGGTVAQYVASMDIDTVDLGVPVLSMHAPYETVAKLDVYMTYLAMGEFFK